MAGKKIFENTLVWTEGKKGVLKIADGPAVEISTPPAFRGPGGFWSPEDMFLASINSCIMTTFLYFAERSGILFAGYESAVRGEIELVDGKFTFTKIIVVPRISVADETQRQKVQDAMKRSEENCLISACVKTPIAVETQIVVG